MVTYNLAHLNQADKQDLIGPIQDDEALFLYSLIKVMRIKSILELGFAYGYSATNFLEAVGDKGVVFSCDVRNVKKLRPNHIPIHKSAGSITPDDIGDYKLDLIFFDCHVYDAQMSCYCSLLAGGIITDKTILVLHDTGTHPSKVINSSYALPNGEFVHQPVERRMVNEFVSMGYSPLCLHPDIDRMSKDELPFRHGLTVMSKFKPLEV